MSEVPLYRLPEKGRADAACAGRGMYRGGKHGLSTEQFPVSAYVGSSKNLKDLKDLAHKKSPHSSTLL